MLYKPNNTIKNHINPRTLANVITITSELSLVIFPNKEAHSIHVADDKVIKLNTTNIYIYNTPRS